ncbi:MAG: LacI family DNA-binding transcriptional regulator [Luteolibacter sp.]
MLLPRPNSGLAKDITDSQAPRMSTANGGMRLRDIAEMLGCSVATVSNAINGRGRISSKMRQQILDKCAELNFVPNSSGRSLRLQRTDAVGVIYAPSFAELFSNVFYARIMEGLAETFGQAGLDLVLGNRRDADGMPSIVRQGKVDALVVLAGVFTAADYEVLRHCPVPLCIVDGCVQSFEADSLTSDGLGGAQQVAQHLWQNGHRNVAMIAYRSSLYNIEQRIAGFLSGLRSCGMDVCEADILIRVDDDIEAARELLARLNSASPPTAVFAVNDTMALNLMEALEQSGRKVPDDVSLVGFDDDPDAACAPVPLTTVGLKKRGIGAVSAGLVLDRLAQPDKPIVHQLQPTHLVVRESVAHL